MGSFERQLRGLSDTWACMGGLKTVMERNDGGRRRRRGGLVYRVRLWRRRRGV